MAKKYYVKELHNPQFKKPYYSAMGQLTKKEAKSHEKPICGDNYMHPYETLEEYNAAIENFRNSGFNIH